MLQRRQRAIERTEDCNWDRALKRGQREIDWTEDCEGTESHRGDTGP